LRLLLVEPSGESENKKGENAKDVTVL
jgi:hypothetical protein